MAIDYSRRKPVHEGVTKGQYEAITEAMRLIVEEDRERGMDSSSEFVCAACVRPRTMVGSVEYDGIRLCNDCATGFEVARINHTAGTCAEYVAERAASRG
ncbi:MAG: hypothetical protein ACYDEB_07450 [Dehalococcoidia bacterium]